MAWSLAFQERLRLAKVQPIVVVRKLEVGGGFLGAWRFSTATDSLLAGAIRGGVSDAGTSVSPRDWSTTIGAFSVTVGSSSLRDLLRVLARGQLAEMLVGFPGQGLADFERVRLGQLWGMRRNAEGTYTLEFRDIIAALGSRITTNVAQLELFYTGAVVGGGNIATTDYTAGDGTLNINSSANFVKQDDAGGSGSLPGLIYITPTTGDPFYLTYTGSTGTTLTGCSGTGALGTTAVDADIGDSVDALAYIDDHPADMARRVLLSSGAFATSGYDTLPASWGYGLPERLVDGTDMSKTRTRTQPASGSDDWDFYSAAQQENGLTWLTTALQGGGFFLTQRQGSITVRAAVDPYDHPPDAELSDADVYQYLDHEVWDSRLSRDYARTMTWSAELPTKTTVGTLAGLPADQTFTIDASAFVWTNQSAWRTELDGRLSVWALRVPERVRWIGPAYLAALTPGDVIRLQSDTLGGRMDYAHGAKGIVTRVIPKWLAWTCEVEVSLLPGWDGPFLDAIA